MEQFEQILLKYGCSKRIEKSYTAIDKIENIVKFTLPLDYKLYLQNYKGFEGQIGEEFVRLWDIDELVKLNNDYSIINNLSNTLGIGSNGGSEFIAIELTSMDNYRIVLSPFIDLDEQYHIEIGTSFADFLISMANGREWFND